MSKDTFFIAIKPGAPLPKTRTTALTTSIMTGITYAISISSIAGLRWLPNGDLEVAVRGTKTALPDEEASQC